MELMTIYNLSNYENGNLKISKEKLNTIEVELANFNQKAKQQIKNFRVKGILKHYENNHYSDNNEITRAEIEAIEYQKPSKL
jgi:ribosomal protein S8E